MTMSPMNTSLEDHLASNGEGRYLVFKIGQDSFASPLLSIREIVDTLVYRYVPNDYDYFLGLANLRGQIIGVLDLGRRFGLEPVSAGKEAVFLVFDAEGTTMAGLVHSVEMVAVIPNEAIIPERKVEMTIPEAALIGIGRESDRLLPLVNLPNLVDSELKTVV